ncbi:M23 family metallopeptidase [Nocardia sp. NBC_01377]|uniref:M23 family metallopeptidase n=1 Tax=Nocardia sp. NBC_01377 TaxID=2903595 RepID=UPI00324AC2C9
MPVTDLLPSLRPGADLPRRHRTATRVVAVSAVISAALSVLIGADKHGADAAVATGPLTTTADTLAAPAAPAENVAFVQPGIPQSAPDPALAEQHRIAEQQHIAEQHHVAVEAARPKTVRPVGGILTSNFGMRWGEMHAGIDFGEPLGAPIATVTDGVVIEAGPATGFGLWVRVQQDDGTVGVYGHVNDILASVGQEVRAGDIIATVGNRGQSTGPHLHYEVHDPEAGKIDPLPWLAQRGIDAFRFPA